MDDAMMCSAQSYDNAATVAGIRGGVQQIGKRIQKSYF